MSWLGWDANNRPLQISGDEMARWALETERSITVGWSDHYQFPSDAVSSPTLKGARVVRPSRDGSKKCSDNAEAAGWSDLAEALRKEGY